MLDLVLGGKPSISGDIGRLNAFGAASPTRVEKVLGYGAGRLANGYWIALLAEPIRSNHVLFAGLTLRSGGREGLPLTNPEDDKRRPHVHDQLIKEYGAVQVHGLAERFAGDPRNLLGEERIVRVLPSIRHQGRNPAAEYPPGGGSGQWTLTAPHKFILAAKVSAEAIMQTAEGWSESIADDAPYDGRAKLARYLAQARCA